MKKLVSIFLAIVLMVSAPFALAESSYTPGTYTAQAEGLNGPVTVEVTFSENAIESVVVAAHKETPGISDGAIEKIPAEIVAGQTLNLDAVSGATYTSNAILNAVADAVAQAGGDAEALRQVEAAASEGQTYEETYDVVVVGAGYGGLCSAVAAAENGASVVLIEKQSVAGGSSAMSGGGVKVAMKQDGENYIQEAYDYWMNEQLQCDPVEGYPKTEFVTAFLEQSEDNLAWLAQQGYEITCLKPGRDGNITVEQVAAALREDTALVSMMLVNNETGCVFPVRETAALLREKGSPALLHCDAVQGFMKVDCDPEGWGVDMMSLSAHKLGGPKGIGALYIGGRMRNPRPLLPGGGQERGLRSGTEATAQIAGFAKAVELRMENHEEKLRHMAEMKALCLEKLLTIPNVVAVGGGTAPHILAVSLQGYPSGNIVTDLGRQGICISAGSACHKGKSSHVVAALGLPKRTAAGVIRISFSPETTVEDIEALYEALRKHQAERCAML